MAGLSAPKIEGKLCDLVCGQIGRRYRAELKAKRDALQAIAARAKKADVTLLFGAKDETHNNAVVLRDALQSQR